MIYQEHADRPNSDFKGIFFTDVPMDRVCLNGQVVTGMEYEPDLDDKLKNYYPYEILKSRQGNNNEETEAEKKEKKRLDEINSDPYLNEPYDPELCHLLRNPGVPDLDRLGAVKGHIDILGLQLEG